MRTRFPITKAERLRRQKISKAMKIIQNQPEVKERIRKQSTGRKHSEETKAKLSTIRTKTNGMRGKHHTKDAKRRISEASVGREVSEETRQKISESSKGKIIPTKQRKQISHKLKEWFTLHKNPFKGKRHSEESKEKMRRANLGRFRGANGPNWQGGIDSLPYGPEWTRWLKQEIKERDLHACVLCAKSGCLLDVHHIDKDKQNNDPSNLITLCKSCHGKANTGVIAQSMLADLLDKYKKEK